VPTRDVSCTWWSDNYATHKHPERRGLAGPPPPRHAALHTDVGLVAELVEVFFSIITRQAIRRGTFVSVKDLVGANPSVHRTAGTTVAIPSPGPRPPTRFSVTRSRVRGFRRRNTSFPAMESSTSRRPFPQSSASFWSAGSPPRAPRRAWPLRARIVLMAAAGESNSVIARRWVVSRPTGDHVAPALAAAGPSGLSEVRPGRGRKPTISAAKVKAVSAATNTDRASRQTHWSCARWRRPRA